MAKFELVPIGDTFTVSELETLLRAVRMVDRDAVAYVHEGTDIAEPCIAFVSETEAASDHA